MMALPMSTLRSFAKLRGTGQPEATSTSSQGTCSWLICMANSSKFFGFLPILGYHTIWRCKVGRECIMKGIALDIELKIHRDFFLRDAVATMPSQPPKICDLECPLERYGRSINTNKRFLMGIGMGRRNEASRKSIQWPHENNFFCSRSQNRNYVFIGVTGNGGSLNGIQHWHRFQAYARLLCAYVAAGFGPEINARRLHAAEESGLGLHNPGSLMEYTVTSTRINSSRAVLFWSTIQLATVPTIMDFYLLWYTNNTCCVVLTVLASALQYILGAVPRDL